MTNNDKVPELTNGEFNNFIEEGIVLIDFFAEWCMPCLMLSPVIEELAEKMKDVKFVKINTDDNQEISKKYGISSIPCLIFFKDGDEVDRVVGAHEGDAIKKKIVGNL